MSLANGYKKAEKNLIKSISKRMSVFFNFFKKIKNDFSKSSKQTYTVMFIPHTEKKALNFKISFLTIFFVCAIVLVLFVTTVTLGVLFVVNNQNSTNSQKTLSIVEKENTQLKDSSLRVKKAAQDYKVALNSAMDTLGLGENSKDSQHSYLGDYASFFSVMEQDSDSLKEVMDLNNVTEFLSKSTDDISRISDFLESQGDLAKEIPTLWPLRGGVGTITTLFGPTTHPFRGYWYLHKGLDIAFVRGTGIIATANGKVVEVETSRDYGLNLTVKHNYGFYTRYAHCDNIYVKEGQVVSQGQRIAALGNTGMSTGPHVHYEVRIGSQNIDPLKFLEMKK